MKISTLSRRSTNRGRRTTAVARAHDGLRRAGYVLLLVMVSVVITGIVLVGVARQSFRLALEAQARERELQARWGALSVQQLLLPTAPSLFEELEQMADDDDESDAPPPTSIRTVLVLGDRQFDVLLADESAKVNVNTLYHFGDRRAVERGVQQATTHARFVRPMLQPETMPLGQFPSGDDEEDDAPPLPPAFRTWGQVFDLSGAGAAAPIRRALPELTSQLTCWGSGRLNFRRAADSSIVEICRLVMTEGRARRVVRKLRENSRLRFENVLQQAGVGRDDQMKLQSLLTQQSACFSIWVTASGPDGFVRRFAVAQPDEKGVVRTFELVF